MKQPNRSFRIAQIWKTVKRKRPVTVQPGKEHADRNDNEIEKKIASGHTSPRQSDFSNANPIETAETQDLTQQHSVTTSNLFESGEPLRVMCVWVPRFGLALYCKDDPHLLIEPSVLAESQSDSAVIVEVGGKAAKAGVAVGMTVAQAGMLCENLTVKIKDQAREDAASDELFTTLQATAPFIEIDSPGRYFISANGFEKLYGGENALAERVIQSVRDLGLSPQIGIGDNAFVARVAAELTAPFTANSVPRNQAREFLEPLPVKHLTVDDEIKEQLGELGLRTIGQIAAFPINELTERFGVQGALMAHLAKGNDPKHFIPEAPKEEISEVMILDEPIFTAVSIGARVQKLLTVILDRIAAKELGASKISVLLKFDNKTYKEIELALDRPSLSVRKFLLQLQKHLERLTFPAGVIELKLRPVVTERLWAKQAELASRPVSRTVSAVKQSMEAPILFRAELRKSPLPEESFTMIAVDSPLSAPSPAKPVERKKQRYNEFEEFEKELRGSLQPAATPRSLVPIDKLPSFMMPLPQDLENPDPAKNAKVHDATHPGAEIHRNVESLDEHEEEYPAFAIQSITGMRLVHPAQAVSVVSEDDSLRTVVINNKRHAIVSQHGPWKIAGRWWGDNYSRWYYEIETKDKRMFLIYQFGGLQNSKWYLQGVFD